MGRTAKFAAGSWIVRQTPKPCEKLLVSRSKIAVAQHGVSGWTLSCEITKRDTLND
jgi:hypothetical protein